MPRKAAMQAFRSFQPQDDAELVMRRYVTRLPNVRFLDEAGVRGVVVKDAAAAGLKVERDGAVEDMTADVIVDASGRNTSFPDWLARRRHRG